MVPRGLRRIVRRNRCRLLWCRLRASGSSLSLDRGGVSAMGLIRSVDLWGIRDSVALMAGVRTVPMGVGVALPMGLANRMAVPRGMTMTVGMTMARGMALPMGQAVAVVMTCGGDTGPVGCHPSSRTVVLTGTRAFALAEGAAIGETFDVVMVTVLR